MSWAEVFGSAEGSEKFPVLPIMGRVTGKGVVGSVKETCRMGAVLMRGWIVA